MFLKRGILREMSPPNFVYNFIARLVLLFYAFEDAIAE
jgi:hypothetical protein